jgi:RNA polymerase sigma-70 factor, ECF subfamily
LLTGGDDVAIPLTELLFGGIDRDEPNARSWTVGQSGVSNHPDRVGELSGDAKSTADIVEAIRAGDLIAFEHLFRDYFNRLSTHARLLVHSTDVAEELAQEVLWSIWERRATWSVRGTLATYLHSAVHHRAQTFLRTRSTHARLLTEAKGDDEVPFVSVPASASNEVEMAELVAEVRRAIRTLPVSRRVVLNLRWNEGLSYAEIAEVVGSSVKAVENQLNRTLRQLRGMLAHLRP